MSRELIFHPNADADLDSILAYLAAFSAAAAENFRAEYLDVSRSLLAFPQRGPVEPCDPNETLRRVVLRQFRNYLIYYRVATDSITILHVFHSSRDLPTLLRESGDV